MAPIRQHTKKLVLTLLFAIGITLAFLGGLWLCNDQISFSHPSGFYNDTFKLEIDCGAIYDIYYTLDGSAPTAESIRYQRGTPIEIADATPNQNLYTARTDLSPGYYQQLLEEYDASNWHYDTPDQSVDKCTVIRAAAFHNGKRIGDSICGVYFVGWQNRPDYKNSYIVSLVAEPDDLFGYENGIMVTGKAFDRHIEQMQADQEPNPRWWWWQANYHGSGYDWERTANITVFNQHLEQEMDQTCGIRIHGGASRAFPLKSIRCYARREYSGLDFFNVSWFGEEINPSKFTLYAGGNDAGGGPVCLNLKDDMISHFSRELHFATMEFIPCALFVNGEFWGFYHISEHYNKNFIADLFSVHENNVVMIKNAELAEGSPSDMQLYTDMVDFISNSDMRDENTYRAACDLIDIDSYIDYYALQIYIARTGDWPNGNYALWRTIEHEESAYGDGKWRWMLFDANSSGMASANSTLVEDDTLQIVLDNDPMFASLFRNLEFQKKFADRILYIGNTILTPEKCGSFMDTYFTDFSGLLQNTNIHVYNDPKEERLAAYIDNLKLFFSGRDAVVRNLLETHLNPRVASSLE